MHYDQTALVGCFDGKIECVILFIYRLYEVSSSCYDSSSGTYSLDKLLPG